MTLDQEVLTDPSYAGEIVVMIAPVLADRDKESGVAGAGIFVDLGFHLPATRGTAAALGRHGLPAAHVDEVGDGPRDPVRLIEEAKVDLVVTTPRRRRGCGGGRPMRRAGLQAGIPCMTTLPGAVEVTRGLAAGEADFTAVQTIQEYQR